MIDNGMQSKAKEVAMQEVAKRTTSIQQAKKDYKEWIKDGLKNGGGGINQDTIDFWHEVIRQIDLICE
jgi:hypothetical protein